jgi:hypothetical protein
LALLHDDRQRARVLVPLPPRLLVPLVPRLLV